MLTRFRPSPAMVVALVALFVSLGGVGYAATKIGTKDIRDFAITESKLRRNSVTGKKLINAAIFTDKIRNGAVTGDKIANGTINNAKVDGSIVISSTPGVALAGANIAPNGVVRRYFNRVGGVLTVSHPSDGVYQVTVPGLEGKLTGETSISTASLGSAMGSIRIADSGGNPVIRTVNMNGNPADRGFGFVVFVQSP